MTSVGSIVGKPKPVYVECNGKPPRFGWWISTIEKGKKQGFYRVVMPARHTLECTCLIERIVHPNAVTPREEANGATTLAQVVAMPNPCKTKGQG